MWDICDIFKTSKRVFIGVAIFGLLGTNAHATVPYPRLKPSPPPLSEFLLEEDAVLLRKALASADRRHWSGVESSMAKINDPVAKDLLRWIRATRDRRAPTETLEYVHKNLSDWPRLTTVRSLAEKRMFGENWSSRKVMSWFGTEEPVSGAVSYTHLTLPTILLV